MRSQLLAIMLVFLSVKLPRITRNSNPVDVMKILRLIQFSMLTFLFPAKVSGKTLSASFLLSV